jgi:putative Mg2+ transporter-C (MgtC) family protein
MQWFEWAFQVLLAQREILLQLVLAAALGGMVGLEREASGKPAGFRTNLVICLGAALVTVISRMVALDAAGVGYRADPGRIAAQVVSGIGFLGAGTIMQARGSVTGLTTAATLWAVAAGAYLPALLTTAVVVLALMILGRVEDHLLLRRSPERAIEVVFGTGEAVLARIERVLGTAGVHVKSVSVQREDDVFTASFRTWGAAEKYSELVHALLQEEAVRKVSLL